MVHHLLVLHSSRRCAPETLRATLDCSSSASSFSEMGFVETWSSPAPRSLRSPIPARRTARPTS
eukprot:2545084-Prymnesium_polylepis.1